MSASPSGRRHYLFWLPDIFILLLGSVVLFGWAFELPALTGISADWKPMVPSTALCFVLGGLSLLANKVSTHCRASAAQGILVWLILVLAGARASELLFSHGFGIDFLLPDWIARYGDTGHMSPQTMAGFLAFGMGMLAVRRVGSHPALLPYHDLRLDLAGNGHWHIGPAMAHHGN